MQNDIQWVRIERSLDAGINTVWAMWTDPALFRQWYGPNGMTVPTAEMDVSVGGKRKICMQMSMPDREMKMWFVGEYIEVIEPTRLVYSESMADEHGNVISPKDMGMPEGHPEVTKVIVELEERDGKTMMTMTHIGVPHDSQGAGGWNQAIDKLANLVTSK